MVDHADVNDASYWTQTITMGPASTTSPAFDAATAVSDSHATFQQLSDALHRQFKTLVHTNEHGSFFMLHLPAFARHVHHTSGMMSSSSPTLRWDSPAITINIYPFLLYEHVCGWVWISFATGRHQYKCFKSVLTPVLVQRAAYLARSRFSFFNCFHYCTDVAPVEDSSHPHDSDTHVSHMPSSFTRAMHVRVCFLSTYPCTACATFIYMGSNQRVRVKDWCCVQPGERDVGKLCPHRRMHDLCGARTTRATSLLAHVVFISFCPAYVSCDSHAPMLQPLRYVCCFGRCLITLCIQLRMQQLTLLSHLCIHAIGFIII